MLEPVKWRWSVVVCGTADHDSPRECQRHMHPSHCTGHHWLLAPHLHEMPAEGKCTHLVSFCESPSSSQSAISWHPQQCDCGLWPWCVLEAARSFYRLMYEEWSGRKGGDREELWLRDLIFSIRSQWRFFLLQVTLQKDGEENLNKWIRQSVYLFEAVYACTTTFRLSFSAISSFLTFIHRWGTYSHWEGICVLNSSLFTNHKPRVLHCK